MKKEYTFVAIIGMFLLSYLLDAVVDPLKLNLTTPYAYLTAQHYQKFPFTTTSIFIRAIAICLTPIWFSWLIEKNYYPKSVSLLVISVLIQLYAVQDVVSGAHVVPLEWAVSLSLGGAALLLPAALLFIRGLAAAAHESMLNAVAPPPPDPNAPTPDWLKEPRIPKRT